MKRLYKVLFFLFGDIFLLTLSLWLSFLIRFDGSIPHVYFRVFPLYLMISLGIKLAAFESYRLYNISWSLVSIYELIAVFKACTMSSLLIVSLSFFLRDIRIFGMVPRSVLLIDYLLTLFFISAFRSIRRIQWQMFKKKALTANKKVLVVGAGNAGEQLVRDMLRTPKAGLFPVGFIDDDPAKRGISIHGVKVLGNRYDIPRIVRKYKIQEIIIAMPSVPSHEIKSIVDIARETELKSIKILPSLNDIFTRKVGISDVRDIRVEDLLGRDPVVIDTEAIESYIGGRTVLITGAGGSIGSELARQITRFKPQSIILLDQEETELFFIRREMKNLAPDIDIAPIICDIRDHSKLERVFARYLPEVVFHAAAYKHVPMMEENPDEAVKNNIIGTLNLAEIAIKFGTEKFVLISTDKAVNPTSVMGASKRVAEMLAIKLNERGITKFVAVRFGNVLGSRGSVIPIFQEQIKRGGPVTVTHPEMKRYFMTISEAVLLVLQAGFMGDGGEVFVLDMGEPVKIVDLAKELIKLNGLEPDVDIPIVFTGLRPGEKLFEELLTAEEGSIATSHSKIYVARINYESNSETLLKRIEELEHLADRGDNTGIIKVLMELLPRYRPDPRIWKDIPERKIEDTTQA